MKCIWPPAHLSQTSCINLLSGVPKWTCNPSLYHAVWSLLLTTVWMSKVSPKYCPSQWNQLPKLPFLLAQTLILPLASFSKTGWNFFAYDSKFRYLKFYSSLKCRLLCSEASEKHEIFNQLASCSLLRPEREVKPVGTNSWHATVSAADI